MTPIVPDAVIYAGLAGVVLSLVVAAASNNWSLRVMLLLALRLAIGWHFLFEGLHKIHSHHVGVAEGNRPFTSEPYFAVAEGPFGEYMRKTYLGDPDAVIAEKITPQANKLAGFDKLTESEQAALCPPAVVQMIDDCAPMSPRNQAAMKAELEKGQKAVAELPPDAGATAVADAKAAEAKAAKRLADAPDADTKYQGKVTSMKAQFAKWLYGVAARDAKAKHVSSDVPQTVPARLAHIALMEKNLATIRDRQEERLGSGHGTEITTTKTAKADLQTAKADLVKDAEAFVDELVKAAGGTPATPAEKPIVFMDKVTMYMITAVGACLLFGFLTPLACLVGAGFLALTYLTHPPFPWYPLPPNTEGNPLFVNKNVIEAVAMLVIAAHPTGRWLGLDALWTRLFEFGRREPV